MEGKKIKSAWEIALEKAEKLGELSELEMKRRQEEEYVPIGQGLANKYLSGLPLRKLQAGLERHDGEAGRLVKKGALSALIQTIAPQDPDVGLRALEAIRQLLDDAAARHVADDIALRLQDQSENTAQDDAEHREWIRRKEERELRAQGIGGSAVDINVEASAEWREFLRGIERQREEELTPLKERLMALARSWG